MSSTGVRKLPYRKLTEQEQNALAQFQDEIHYSTRYKDDDFEYRHVILPKLMLKSIPKDYFDHESGTLRLLHEDEWRGLGITQVSQFLDGQWAFLVWLDFPCRRLINCASDYVVRFLTCSESWLGPLRDASARTLDTAVQTPASLKHCD